MMKLNRSNLASLPTTVLISFLVLAQCTWTYAREDIKWAPDDRVGFRATVKDPVTKKKIARMWECGTYLAPEENGSVNDSVGIDLRAPSPETFEERLVQILAERGRSAIQGSHIYVTGAKMGNEIPVRLQYMEVLRRHGFDEDDLQLVVLSVPDRSLFKQGVRGIVKGLWNEMRFLKFSKIRDYQIPLYDEVVNALTATYLIEGAMLVFHKTKEDSLVDFTATALMHLFIMTAFLTWIKTFSSWMNRDPKTVSTFLKQAAMSVPFVANFNVLGNLEDIVGHVSSHGLLDNIRDGLRKSGEVMSEQVLTLALQVLFYTVGIAKATRRWPEIQKGERRSEAARNMVALIEIPILTLDAIFIAMASYGKDFRTVSEWTNGLISEDIPFLSQFTFNQGQMNLALLTLASSVVAIWPRMLDVFFPVYFKTAPKPVLAFFGLLNAVTIKPLKAPTNWFVKRVLVPMKMVRPPEPEPIPGKSGS